MDLDLPSLYLLGLQKPHELRARDDLGVPGVRGEVGLEKLAIVVEQILLKIFFKTIYIYCMFCYRS